MAQIVGTAAGDSLTGGSGNDTIQGLDGYDTIDGGGGNDFLSGGPGFDRFVFAASADYGHDRIDGGADFDLISFHESPGRSAISVDLRAGTLSGGGANGAGSATLVSIEGVIGTSFDDHLVGNDATGHLEGGRGDDTIIGGNGGGSLHGDDGNDEIRGGTGDDILHAGAGADTLVGGAGNDRFWQLDFLERDLIDGGEGRDNVFAASAVSPVVVDLSAGTMSGGDFHGRGGATLISIEDFDSGSSHDHITGSSVANRLAGSSGNDTLHGAAGNDTLTGGFGEDRFFFGQAPSAANADLVTDFVSGTDKIVLDPAAHANLGIVGNFAAGDARFFAGAGAESGHDPSDRVIYDTSSGELYYDADGSGAGAAQLIATLEGAPALVASDIAAGSGAPAERPRYDLRTVVDHGASDNRVDIVFMGDGYTAEQLADYAAHVNGLIGYMFDDSLLTQPFGRYESFFNIHVIDVISNESGADHPGSNRDTALGANYTAGGTLFIDFVAASTVLADTLRETDLEAEMRFVAVNDPQGGGIAGSFAVYSTASGGARDVALHEGAHHFAHLADQYWSSGMHWPGGELSNPDITADPSGAKWARWLGYDQPGIGIIGAYEGGAHHETDIYRPSVNSKMRSLGQPFDAVGREAFILEFYELVDPLDGHLANAEPLRNTDVFWVDTIDPNVLRVDWTVNGTTFNNAGEQISLAALGRSGGDFTISARAYDPTDWVRVADRSSLEQTVSWTVINDGVRIGGGGNDSLFVGSGNDTLRGGGGNDTLSGGVGTDTAVYTAARSQYTVLGTSGGTLAVGHGISGADGVDLLTGMERLQFADGEMAASQASSVRRYTASHADLIQAFGTNDDAALGHYFNYGYAEGRQVSFEGLSYIASYADLIRALGTNAAAGVDHYLNYGYAEARSVSFDGLRYIASYGDLIQAYGANAASGASHYITHGHVEGRAATFDSLRYIASYGDLVQAFGADAAAGAGHYINHGHVEGRLATFDGLRYIASYGDLVQAYGTNAAAGVDHYLNYGYGEGRTVSFEGLRYIASHGDLIDVCGANAPAGTVHFINYGFAEGRAISFNPAQYLANYSDLQAAFGGDLQAASAHYIVHGRGEGRTDLQLVFNGTTGNDVLVGNAAANTMSGAAGNDTLTGGAASDSFDFTAEPGATNADQITDFVSGTDKLRLDDAAHAGIGPAGNFAAGDARFAAGEGFTSGRDADDRVIYDTTTGNLYYDADGSDPGAAQLIATLQGRPGIVATDIAVI